VESRKNQTDKIPKPEPNIDPALVKETFNLLASKGFIKFTETGAYIPTERGWKLLREIKTFKEEIRGKGNKNVSDCNESIKFVREESGDECTLVVGCDKGVNDLKEEFKNALKEGAFLEVHIRVDGEEEKITAYGSPALKLTGNCIEIRTDDKINGCTIGIMANRKISDLNPNFLRKIREEKEVEVVFLARL